MGWQAELALGQATAFGQEPPPEVIVSAERTADVVLETKVQKALQEDPYLFTDHVSVAAENGVVRIQGTVYNVQDMRRILRLARRIAGKRRVINLLELVVEDDDGTG